MAITATHALMLAVAREMLEGTIGPDEAHRASRLGLRMFAVGEDESVRYSDMPLAELARTVGDLEPAG